MANYISLYSGSSGNCSIIEENGNFILIDIGKSARLTNNALTSIGLDIKKLQGIFISHEHQDHVAGLKVFLKKLDVPVYSNTFSLNHMKINDLIPKHIKTYDNVFSGVNVGDFYIKGFETPHDAASCTGFKVVSKKGKSLALATDLGHVTDDVYNNLKGNDVVVLESNYDENMLLAGEYPYFLKTRILSDTGHLSNLQASNTALNLIKDGLTNLRFCHLSNNNNMPSLALSQLASLAHQKGMKIEKDVLVSVNQRHDISPKIEF